MTNTIWMDSLYLTQTVHKQKYEFGKIILSEH